MTVANNRVTRVYQGNGAATRFPTDILIQNNEQVAVYIRETFGDTLQESGIDYSIDAVTPAEQSSTPSLTETFTVVFGTAPAAGSQVVIERIITPLQTLDLENSEAFYPEAVETALDLAMMGVQESVENSKRSIRVAAGGRLDPLPGAQRRAGHVVGFDSAGNLEIFPSNLSPNVARLDVENTFAERNIFQAPTIFEAGVTIEDAIIVHDDTTLEGNLELKGTLTLANKLEGSHIGDGQISTDHLANDAVTTPKILDANITTRKILDEAITDNKLTPATVDKIDRAPTAPPGGAAGQNKVWKTDGSGVPGWRADIDTTSNITVNRTEVTQALTIHDDVTTKAAISNLDRFIFSDESVAGDPNRYATAREVAAFVRARIVDADLPATIARDSEIDTKINARITTDQVARIPTDPSAQLHKTWSTDGAGVADWREGAGINIHESLNTEMTAPASADRIAVTDESAPNDPTHWLSLGNLWTYFQRIADGRYLRAIADRAVTLAKMAKGRAGDILYYNSSGEPTLLRRGSNGQVLTLDNGVPTWQNASGGRDQNTVIAKLTSLPMNTLAQINPGVAASLDLSATINVEDSTSLIKIELFGFHSISEVDVIIQRGSTTVAMFLELESFNSRDEVQVAYDTPGNTGNTVYSVAVMNTSENNAIGHTPADFLYGNETDFTLGRRPFIRLTEIFVA